MRYDEMPPELRRATEALAEKAAVATRAAEQIAAVYGWPVDSVVANLQHLRDYRCWKRIPRCFNGWGVGLCALPNWHDGDCSPYRRKEA